MMKMKENPGKKTSIQEKVVILHRFSNMSRYRTGHRINKRAIAMMVLLLMLAAPVGRQVADAQIIILNGDETNSERNNLTNWESGTVPVPPQGWGDDWFPDDFAPLGNGMFLLAGLGASYLLGKRMRDKKRKD